MADDTRIYIDKSEFNSKIDAFDGKLNDLKTLLTEYEALRDRAKRVWGDADENQQKAIDACTSAINVVKKRIEQTEADRNALKQLDELAFNKQAEFGSQIEEAKRFTDALLG